MREPKQQHNLAKPLAIDCIGTWQIEMKVAERLLREEGPPFGAFLNVQCPTSKGGSVTVVKELRFSFLERTFVDFGEQVVLSDFRWV